MSQPSVHVYFTNSNSLIDHKIAQYLVHLNQQMIWLFDKYMRERLFKMLIAKVN